MSRVTNVVLVMSPASPQDLDPWLERIRQWRDEDDRRFPLASLATSALPAGWTGGNVPLRASVTIGALNHLPLEEYLAFLRSLPWEDRARPVQMLVQEQEDDVFRLYPIFPLERAAPDALREQAMDEMESAMPPAERWLVGPIKSGSELNPLDEACRRYLETRGYVHARLQKAP